MAGTPRVLRRARGYAPAPLALPPGFEAAPQLLAMGGELKATFCLVKDGEAILSQHQGDLENAETFDDYRRALALYAQLFDHAPAALVADQHPGISLGQARARRERARRARCRSSRSSIITPTSPPAWPRTRYPLDAPPALGIVLDGLGWGDDGTIWGGEFLLADYRSLRAARPLQAGGDARRRAGGARALAQSLRPSDGRDGLGGVQDEFRRARTLRRSCAPAARDAGRDEPQRRQCAQGLVLRPAVRRGRRRAQHLPRPAGL